MADGYVINAQIKNQVIQVNLANEGVGAVVAPQVINANIQGAVIVQPSENTQLSLLNDDTVTFSPGLLVRTNTLGTGVVRASASDQPALGWASVGAEPDATEIVKVQQGMLVLTDWTSVAGVATLTPNQEYYLSLVGGKIVSTPDQSTAVFVQYVGTALTPTTLSIALGEPIYL